MLKITLAVFSFFILFYLNYVSKIGSCFSLQQKTHVVNPDSMWELIKKKHKKHYVFSLYYSKSCPYCDKVKRYLKKNNQVALIEDEENESKNTLKKLKRPIIVIAKDIFADSLYNKTYFYYELLRRAKRVQVPAMGYKNCIMFESDDIINIINQLTHFVLTKSPLTDRHRNKINRGENKSHLQAEVKTDLIEDNENASEQNITQHLKNTKRKKQKKKTDDRNETESTDEDK